MNVYTKFYIKEQLIIEILNHWYLEDDNCTVRIDGFLSHMSISIQKVLILIK